MLILREHETPKGLLVAVCDEGLIGEEFTGEGVQLTVSEEFYGGELVDPTAVIESLERATVANLVGQEAVGVAIDNGHIDEAQILEVGETVHAQFLRMAQW